MCRVILLLVERSPFDGVILRLTTVDPAGHTHNFAWEARHALMPSGAPTGAPRRPAASAEGGLARMGSPRRLLVAIKGGGDLASAVAHRLFREGRAVVIVEEPEPRVVRRRMAFAQAVFDGEATVEGVRTVRTASVSATRRLLETREAIPLLVDPTGEAIRALRPAVLVDGRMRKRQRSDSSVAEAPLVIGLGPGFLAGREAHVVIETARGQNLGKIIAEGEALPYDGMPVDLGGFAKERYLYSPGAGVFRTRLDIGALVEAGQAVGEVGDAAVVARVGGTIRGILKNGVRVTQGQKLVDIDPREEAILTGISPKAHAIAEGVAAAIAAWEASPNRAEQPHTPGSDQ